jgi:glyoxylase I family protein
MLFLRRQLLRTLSICFRVELHLGAEPTRHSGADSRTAKALSSPCGGRCSRWDRWGNGNGKSDRNRRILFRAKDPKALGRWYQQHLRISLTPSSYEHSVWQQEAGPTVFDPQPETSDFFKGTDKVWMLNFRVRDLDKMAAQLRAAGIAVEIDRQSYRNGRFASLHDPEGNPIQLWQPKVPDAPH